VKLYQHPASTTCRPLLMFIAEHKLAIDLQVVDLFSGEHLGDAYAAINPSRLVPTLQDGDFLLTESSAILKYVADKFDSTAYPKPLQARARVNEMMDWINTQLSRDLAYGTVYAQIFPHHRRPGDEVHRATVAWGQERAQRWMRVLDQDLLGPERQFLCGHQITIADYFGAAFVHLAEVIRSDLSRYPNLQRWLGRMKALPSWSPAYAGVEAFAAGLPRDQLLTV
jgi:glutathione S-transferase